jgi:hypothetical protein
MGVSIPLSLGEVLGGGWGFGPVLNQGSMRSFMR